MKQAVNETSYQWIEIGKVEVSGSTIHIDPIMTASGRGNMVFETLTESVKDIPEVSEVSPVEFQHIPQQDIDLTSKIDTPSV